IIRAAPGMRTATTTWSGTGPRGVTRSRQPAPVQDSSRAPGTRVFEQRGGERRMLPAMSIRAGVLIERLDLSFGPGLTVLTGETGAGKSILLDSLSLALGARADSGLVRAGQEQASVTAFFAPDFAHPAFGLLMEQGLEAEDEIVIRRLVN